MVKVEVGPELLLLAGPFAAICQHYNADRLSGQGNGTVAVLRGSELLGHIPVLDNGDLVKVTVDEQAHKLYVQFREMVLVMKG